MSCSFWKIYGAMLLVPTVLKTVRVCSCACLHCLLGAEELLAFDETTPLAGLAMASIATRGARTEISRLKDHSALVWSYFLVLFGHGGACDQAYTWVLARKEAPSSTRGGGFPFGSTRYSRRCLPRRYRPPRGARASSDDPTAHRNAPAAASMTGIGPRLVGTPIVRCSAGRR